MQYKEIKLSVNHCDQIEGARLFMYLIDNSEEMVKDRKRPAVVICPGGGYAVTSDREAEPVALKFLGAGYHVFVLRYHVAPVRFPVALLELGKTVCLIREHANEWNIDEKQVYLAGFSAGGHLALSLGVFWKEKWLSKELMTNEEMLRPNGCILSYPVVTAGEYAHRASFDNLLGDQDELYPKLSLENQVSKDTPPIFLWHTYSDQTVPVENSLLLIQALRKYQVPVEFHMYPEGIHGLSLATEETINAKGLGVQKECAGWFSLAIDWLSRQTKQEESAYIK